LTEEPQIKPTSTCLCPKRRWHNQSGKPLIKRLQTVQINRATSQIPQQHHRAGPSVHQETTRPMLGFKALHSAQATIAGIEAAHMIRKGQVPNDNRTSFQLFAELAE
jgi:putative transposase